MHGVIKSVEWCGHSNYAWLIRPVPGGLDKFHVFAWAQNPWQRPSVSSVNSRTSPSVDGELFYICRRRQNGQEHLAKVVKLKEEADMVFTDIHSSDIGAHCGIDKTHNAIIQRFYWPGMEGDIRKWVSEYSTIPHFLINHIQSTE